MTILSIWAGLPSFWSALWSECFRYAHPAFALSHAPQLFNTSLHYSYGDRADRNDKAHIVFPFDVLPDNIIKTPLGETPPALSFDGLPDVEQKSKEKIVPGFICIYLVPSLPLFTLFSQGPAPFILNMWTGSVGVSLRYGSPLLLVFRSLSSASWSAQSVTVHILGRQRSAYCGVHFAEGMRCAR